MKSIYNVLALFFLRSLRDSSHETWLNFLALPGHYLENYFKEKYKAVDETALIFVSMTLHLSHLSRSFITITVTTFLRPVILNKRNKFRDVFGVAIWNFAIDLILEMAKFWESAVLTYLVFLSIHLLSV